MVERASVMGGEHLEAELRYRCRSAPEFVRANIDRRRESRGLLPLWPELRHRDGARSQRPRRVRFWKAFLAAYGHRG